MKKDRMVRCAIAKAVDILRDIHGQVRQSGEYEEISDHELKPFTITVCARDIKWLIEELEDAERYVSRSMVDIEAIVKGIEKMCGEE